MIHSLLNEFADLIAANQIEIYNEFSLQHELGIFLREKLPNYKVQFERNTDFFSIRNTVKREIDIVVYNNSERYAIELKFPLNGMYPEQMFSFVKDICFMEQLKLEGFTNTYCMTVVRERPFYAGTKQDGIYAFFRTNTPITGTITKPTGSKHEAYTIQGTYPIHWKPCGKNTMYYVVDIKNDAQ